MHSCTAAQLQPKVIFFRILCFSFRPYCFKTCVLDLAKIQLNCIGEEQICPGQKIYDLPNNIYFVVHFSWIIFFVLKETSNYTTNTVVVWPRKGYNCGLQKITVPVLLSIAATDITRVCCCLVTSLGIITNKHYTKTKLP